MLTMSCDVGPAAVRPLAGRSVSSPHLRGGGQIPPAGVQKQTVLNRRTLSVEIGNLDMGA